MKKFYFFFLMVTTVASAQQTQPLTVEYIMRDQAWLGTAPGNYRWSGDSRTVYFDWNPENKDKSELYKVSVASGKPERTTPEEGKNGILPDYVYNPERSLGVIEEGGDLFLYVVKQQRKTRLTQTLEREFNPVFLTDGTIAFQRGNNLFVLNHRSGFLRQLTNFISRKSPELKAGGQDEWLKQDQLSLFDVLQGKKKAGAQNPVTVLLPEKPLRAIELKDNVLNGLSVSPDARFITYRLVNTPERAKQTFVPAFVTESGYTAEIRGRTKVGEPLPVSKAYIYDRQRDTVYQVQTAEIPGIRDLPDYLKDYPEKLASAKARAAERAVTFFGPFWNKTGSLAVVAALAEDNKDFWILQLNTLTGRLIPIDRQRDEAWIGGPGIGPRNLFWIDNQHIAYQSEASGYAHIYSADVAAGTQ